MLLVFASHWPIRHLLGFPAAVREGEEKREGTEGRKRGERRRRDEEGEELARLLFLSSHKELSPKASRPKTSREPHSHLQGLGDCMQSPCSRVSRAHIFACVFFCNLPGVCCSTQDQIQQASDCEVIYTALAVFLRYFFNTQE